MATEIRKVLNLSLGDSPKNLRELKSDIYEIKSAIGDMVVAGQTGTTAYDQATKLLAQDMNLLRQTQNATKSEVAALDGSYNALVQRMRELKTEWRATNDEARRGELTKEITNVNNQLKALDYQVGNFQRNVGNYGNAWEGLSQTFNTVQGSGSQFVSGLQAMSGALNLTTAESDNMNESLNIMRGAVGVLNSAKGIAGLVKQLASQRKATQEAKKAAQEETAALNTQKAATDKVTVSTTAASVATKVLKAALMTIGIGLIIAALGELAAHLDKVTEWFNKLAAKLGIVNAESQKLKKSNEQLNESFEKQNDDLDKAVELMQAKGAEQSEILKEQRKVIEAEILEAKAVNDKVAARITELEVSGKRRGELKRLREQYEKNTKLISDLEHKLAVNVAKAETERTNAAKKAADERAKAAKAEADKKKREEEAAQKKLEDEAKEGQKTILDIEKAGYTAREKAKAEYDERIASLTKGQAAEEQIAMAAGLPTKEIIDKYTLAMGEALKQYYADLQKAYEEEFNDFSDKERRKLEISQEYLKLAKKNVRDAAAMGFDVNGSLGLTISQSDLQIVKTTLKGYTDALQEFIVNFRDQFGKAIEPNDLEKLVPEYLKDPAAFQLRFGEPMTTAIKEFYETTKEINEAGLQMISNTVDAQTSMIWNLINEGNVKGADEAIKSLEKFILSAEETMGVKDMGTRAAKKLKEGFYLEMAQDTDAKKSDALGFAEEWFKLATEGKVGEGLDKIKEKYKEMVREIKYNSLEKNLLKPLESVTNMLDSVAQAWQATIRAQVDAGKKSEEEGRKAFERSKVLQYATAGINTAAAVIQALADPAVPTFYLRAINAAAALATGVAQIAQISATHYGSTGSAATSTPQLVDRTPVVNTVSLNASEAGQGVAQNMRVYVVESDITEAQDRSRARVTESTF